MFSTKSGQKFGSAYVAKKKDQMHDKASQVLKDTDKHEAAEKPMFEAGEKEGMKEAPEHDEQKPMQEDPKSVVSQHGAANTVHIAHDHKAKKHHVISTHSDGHVHESEHADAKSAHDAASALAGGDQQSAEAPGMEAPAADGFKMPRLA